MRWRMPAEALQRHIPERLSIDTFDGKAWVGLTPFTIWDARPVFMTPLLHSGGTVNVEIWPLEEV
jgi:uncharacterized protein